MGKLTDRRIRNLKTPGRHPDGETLYLVVAPSGYRSWIQRLVISGRRRDMGLGPYPLVSLAEARRRAQDNRALARSGGDPMSERQAAAGVPSFEALARQHFAENSNSWRNAKHRVQWLTSLEAYAFPSLGGLRVHEISRRHVIDTLTSPSGPPSRRPRGASGSASAPSWTGPSPWSTSTTTRRGTLSTPPCPDSPALGLTTAPSPTESCRQLSGPLGTPVKARR